MRALPVTIADLEVAAEWLKSYEPNDDAGDRAVALALTRVAKKLLREVEERKIENLRSQVSRSAGRRVPLAKIKALVGRAENRKWRTQ